MSDFLAERYDKIFNEAMNLATVWRQRLTNGNGDRDQNADQHKRCLLRAARFARMADGTRIRYGEQMAIVGDDGKITRIKP